MQPRKDQPETRPFSIEEELARSIGETALRSPHPVLVPRQEEYRAVDYAPPAVRVLAEPLEDFGKHTAAAVLQGYESAAREFEALGAELTTNLKNIEASKTETMATIAELKEAAACYREEGKRVALLVENHASLTTEVRATCRALREKIASPPT